MLEVDPQKRGQLAQVLAHPFLAPHVYRLTTTLGALPCNNSTSPRRPSVTLLGQSLLFSQTRPQRSVSPFSPIVTNIIRGEWDANHQFRSEVSDDITIFNIADVKKI